jgi:hypothetical protein
MDLSKYEDIYYVHAENESAVNGDEYSSEEDAIETALDNARNSYGDQYVVTHVLTRRIGAVKFTFDRD